MPSELGRRLVTIHLPITIDRLAAITSAIDDAFGGGLVFVGDDEPMIHFHEPARSDE